MWVNHKSRFEFVHVRLGEWLGWPQASPREPLRCHISSLVIVETLKDSFEETQTGQTLLWSPVNHNSTLRDHISKSREITEHFVAYLPHKVKLDPTSIKNPMLRLDCAGTLPPQTSRLLPAAVAARGAPEREVDTLPPPATPRGSGRPEGVW